MSNFADLQDRLSTARNPRNGKPLQNNTRLYGNEDGSVAVRLHQTDVVTFHPDGSFVLDSGGWQTLTTKDRMNGWSPAQVSQCNKEWFVLLPSYTFSTDYPSYVDYPEGEYDRYTADYRAWSVKNEAKRKANTVPYFDGMHIAADGTVLNGPSPAEWAEYEALRKARRKMLTRYIGQVRRALDKGMPMPSGGDCWGCCMREVGTGEEVFGSEHLLSHMEEGYVVPSLLVNALREAGYADMGVAMWLGMNPEAGTMGGPGARHDNAVVSRAVRKHMERKVVPMPPRGK